MIVTAQVDEVRESIRIRVAPAALPLLRRPFSGQPQLLVPFDHTYPLGPRDPDPRAIDWRGEAVDGNGHWGYDWYLRMFTPILAAADSVVRFAGREEPWSCPALGGAMVAAKIVRIRHTASTGEIFVTWYVHLDRVDVQEGDSVRAGQQIGLSGNTGCSVVPHLHFEVWREHYRRGGAQEGYVRITDPSGWRGPGVDPWLLHPDGVASTWLWIPGEEPSLIPDQVIVFGGSRAAHGISPGARAPGSSLMRER